MKQRSPVRSRVPVRGPTRRAATLPDLLILNVVALVLLALFLNGTLGEWGGDNIQFQLLARALVSGDGYVDLHLAGNPPHVRYPPLFPLLLAPFVALGAPLAAMKGWVAVLSVAGVNAAYLLLAETCGRLTALLAALCTLCAGAFLDPALSTMSDGPYFLVSAVALHRLHRLSRAEETRLFALLTCGLLVAAAILVRTVGVVLLPALVAQAVLGGGPSVPARQRLTRLLVVGVVVGLATGPWFIHVAGSREASEQTYLHEFAVKPRAAQPRVTTAELEDAPGLVERILRRPMQNLRDLRNRLAEAAAPSGIERLGRRWTAAFSTAFVALCGVLALLTLAGLAQGLLFRRRIHDFYVAAYLALLFVWVGGGFRLVMPILVFLFAYCHEGVASLGLMAAKLTADDARRRLTDGFHRAGTVLLGLLVVANLGVTFAFPGIHDRLCGRYKPWWTDYLAATRELGTVAAPGELVVSLPSNVPYYVAGLQAPRLVTRQGNDEGALLAVLESETDYVISTPFLRTYSTRLCSALESHPEHFKEIDRRATVRVYRVVRDPE